MYQKNLFEPELIYHVYNHAVGFENLYEDREHYLMFMNRLIERCSHVFEFYAITLMPNHFHIVLKVRPLLELKEVMSSYQKIKFSIDSKQDAEYNLSRFISYVFASFLNGYVQKYNLLVGRKGGLLRTNSKRKIIHDDNYFKQVIRYVHLNPIKHGFVQDAKEWAYSSFHFCLNNDDSVIPVKEIFKVYGGSKKFLKFHNEKDIEDLDLD
jgi:REP element-mobilizing transposase RayT